MNTWLKGKRWKIKYLSFICQKGESDKLNAKYKKPNNIETEIIEIAIEHEKKNLDL